MKILKLTNRREGKDLILTLGKTGTIEIDFWDNGTKEGFTFDKENADKLKKFVKDYF